MPCDSPRGRVGSVIGRPIRACTDGERETRAVPAPLGNYRGRLDLGASRAHRVAKVDDPVSGLLEAGCDAAARPMRPAGFGTPASGGPMTA
jgi:hypothetical protein